MIDDKTRRVAAARPADDYANPDSIHRMADVAMRYGVSIDTLRKWRFLGTGPRSFKLGGRVVYRESDLQAWMKAEEQATAVSGTAS